MSKVRTPLLWNVERTCRIGVGVKAASHGEVLDEHPLALRKAFQRSEVQPGFPFVGQLLVRHGQKDMAVSRGVTSDRMRIFSEARCASKGMRAAHTHVASTFPRLRSGLLGRGLLGRLRTARGLRHTLWCEPVGRLADSRLRRFPA